MIFMRSCAAPRLMSAVPFSHTFIIGQGPLYVSFYLFPCLFLTTTFSHTIYLCGFLFEFSFWLGLGLGCQLHSSYLEMSQNSQDWGILRTRLGLVWDVSGTCLAGDTFLGNFGQGHGTSLRNKKKDIGQIDSGHFWRCPKMVRTGTF